MQEKHSLHQFNRFATIQKAIDTTLEPGDTRRMLKLYRLRDRIYVNLDPISRQMAAALIDCSSKPHKLSKLEIIAKGYH